MAFQTNRRRFLEAIALSGADLAVLAKADQKAKFQSFDGPSQSSAGVKSENRASSRSVKSGDAYAQFDPDTATWTCGSSLTEQRLQLRDGKFLLLSLENRLTGTEFAAASDSDEFRFVFAGRERSGATGGYELIVAIGTFYFDAGEGSGMERRYEVLALDGDGNQSATVLATA